MAAEISPVTKCLGLISQYNSASMPPGGLQVANDCVITREDVVQDRRGYEAYGTLSSNATNNFSYRSRVLVAHGTAIAYDNGSGTFADYSGTYTPPTGYKIRAFPAKNNLYVTTSTGVKVFSDVAGTAARSAGVARALDLTLTLNAAGAGFLTTGNYQVAYRAVMVTIDPNGNRIVGYPSQRAFITNTAGTGKNVDVKIYFTSEVTTSTILQFYRTAIAAGTATNDTAGDEMALVYQVNPSSTDISNGYITFTDSLDDSIRLTSNPLYTNNSQQGLVQGNERPPLSNEIALYKSNFAVYANASTLQTLSFAVVGVSSLVAGKTLIIAGTTYNFAAGAGAENTATGTIGVTSTGVVAVDIDLTARSLVRVINRYATNTSVYAFYTSTSQGLPGQIRLEARSLGASTFTLLASDAAISLMISPTAPVSPATSTQLTSSNYTATNALYLSKYQEFEAVPSANLFYVGDANEEILRVIPLRDSAIIIKHSSIWRMTGDSISSIVITPIDLTVACKAIDSIALLSNTVFMLSNQGVVAITENGVEVVSRPIEPNFLPIILGTNAADNTYGIAYESDRQYLISCPSASSGVADQTYVYNIFTKAWTRWSFAIACGIVDIATDKLYFSKPSSSIVYRERKDYSDTDYQDPQHTITINTITTDTLNVTATTVVPEEGWVIIQNDSYQAIESVTLLSANTYLIVLTQDAPTAWATGSAVLSPSVGMEIQWQDWDMGNPATLKQVSEVTVIADNQTGANTATGLIMTFTTNFDSEIETVSVPILVNSWGSGPWGSFTWGGSGDPTGYRTYVPRNKQFCRLINLGVRHVNARERLSIAGCAYLNRQISGNNTK
jgi:hypothetical protein